MDCARTSLRHGAERVTIAYRRTRSELVVDERKSLPGRGAWVHPTLECTDAATRRRAFVRALRVSGPLDTQTITQHLQRNG